MTDDTKTRLIEAAGQAFAENGYEATSIRDICQRAEANVAAVNYHFGDKRQLYVSAVRHAQFCRQEDVPFPEYPPDLPPAQRLRGFIRTMFERMLETDRPRWHLELMLRELARPTEACVTVVDDYIRPMSEVLRAILRDITPDTLSEEKKWMIGFSIVGQVLFYYVHRPIISLLLGPSAEQPSIDQLADHVTQFTLAALGHGPSVLSEEAPR